MMHVLLAPSDMIVLGLQPDWGGTAVVNLRLTIPLAVSLPGKCLNGCRSH
jgi:hypothetical protein